MWLKAIFNDFVVRLRDDLPYFRYNRTTVLFVCVVRLYQKTRKLGTIALQLDRTIVALLRFDGVKHESRATSIFLAAYKILRRIRRCAVEHLLVLRNA